MPSAAQEYADRLIDSIIECLAQCAAAEDTAACARNFVSRLRRDPTWLACDVDRVERSVLREVQFVEFSSLRMGGARRRAS
jgi:hypothetical protein